jgi:hypothetical protein
MDWVSGKTFRAQSAAFTSASISSISECWKLASNHAEKSMTTCHGITGDGSDAGGAEGGLTQVPPVKHINKVLCTILTENV